MLYYIGYRTSVKIVNEEWSLEVAAPSHTQTYSAATPSVLQPALAYLLCTRISSQRVWAAGYRYSPRVFRGERLGWWSCLPYTDGYIFQSYFVKSWEFSGMVDDAKEDPFFPLEILMNMGSPLRHEIIFKPGHLLTLSALGYIEMIKLP